MYTWYDLLGNIGVVLIIGSYLWLQLGRIEGRSRKYSAINAAGAGLILFSLLSDFNLSAAVVEVFWLIISLIGIWGGKIKKIQ